MLVIWFWRAVLVICGHVSTVTLRLSNASLNLRTYATDRWYTLARTRLEDKKTRLLAKLLEAEAAKGR